MQDGLAEAIVYNMYDLNSGDLFTDVEREEAISIYLKKNPTKMNRKCLQNIIKYLEQKYQKIEEENDRLRRQIDILMEHDVL